MKRIVIIGSILLFAWNSIMALPVHPHYLKQITENGDTAALTRLQHRMKDIQALQARRVANATNAEKPVPVNQAQNGLIILVNFSNLKFKTEKAELDSMFMGHNYTREYYNSRERKNISAKGSVRQYFHDASFGQYNPHFDVVGPFTVSQTCRYYGENTANDNDKKVGELIREACVLADKNGVDFSKYDNNNDGKVDYVYIYYAGYSESSYPDVLDTCVWPHASIISNLTLDGKTIEKYACSGELDYHSGQHDGIGTFCHEFSHILGLPDLYCTDNSSTHKTSGDWDVMDMGEYNNDGNTPPSYSAYERWFMGWTSPIILSASGDIILDELQSSNQTMIITADGTQTGSGNCPNPTEFYTLENRQQTGWDEFLPGHGLLITKVNYTYRAWTYNTPNNDPDNIGVDIVEADGDSNSKKSGKATDVFPAGNTRFIPYAQYPIENIAEKNGKISFVFAGGASLQCDDYEYRCSSQAQAFAKGNNVRGERLWNVSVANPDITAFSYVSGKGTRFGKSNTSPQTVSIFTTDKGTCTPTSVHVWASRYSGGDGTVSVMVGGKEIGATQVLSDENALYAFFNSNGYNGKIEVLLKNTKGFIQVQGIDLFYNEVGITNTQEKAASAQKILQNGQLYIRQSEHLYTPTGLLVK